MHIKKTIKFIEYRKYSFIISSIVIIAGILSIAFTLINKGDLNWGIDFSGGIAATLAIDIEKDIPVEEIRSIYDKNGYDTIISKIHSDLIKGVNNQFFIKIKIDDAEKLKDVVTAVESTIRKPLLDKYGDHIIIRDEEGYEPTIGRDLRESAGMIAVLVLVLILIYIAMRFQVKFGIAAVLCLVHDSLVIIGVTSLIGREITIPLVVAILTVMGYSLNDTIVIFDRIRENSRNIKDSDYLHIINKSITQSLSRTIVTSITTLLGAIPLVIISAMLDIEMLFDISFFITIGVLVGTYSSVFIASPILYIWEGLAKKYGWDKKNKKKVTKEVESV